MPGAHAASVEATLDAMRARYDAMPEAVDPIDSLSRELTPAFTAAAMRPLARWFDEGGEPEFFAQAVTHALGNVLASLGNTLAAADGAQAGTIVAMGEALLGRALTAHLSPEREKIVWFLAPAPGGQA